MALDARAAAAKAVGQVLSGKSLNQVLPLMLEKVSIRDRALVQQLCYGTLRKYPQLQGLLKQLLEKPLRGKDRDVYGLLLIGLYQLDALRVPDHAAVATTVDAARALKKPWARGLTNAVLRRYLREQEKLVEALDPAASAQHPPWLYNKILDQWPVKAASIFEANNNQADMCLRVNQHQLKRHLYLAKLADADIPARASPICEQGIRLDRAVDVTELPGFAEGEVSVQDEAAQLAAGLLQAAPGERVLDACAAPGGKTCHILELQPDIQEMVAMDVDSQRLERVAENLHRLQLKATQLAADASSPPAGLAKGSFEKILVDAPCSASGVIRRHPDVKILRLEQDITQLADQQLHILIGLWPLLKPGGKLLYATCSIFDEENSQVLARFLNRQADADYCMPEEDWGVPKPFGRQLLPSIGGPDGLFYSLLTKTG